MLRFIDAVWHWITGRSVAQTVEYLWRAIAEDDNGQTFSFWFSAFAEPDKRCACEVKHRFPHVIDFGEQPSTRGPRYRQDHTRTDCHVVQLEQVKGPLVRVALTCGTSSCRAYPTTLGEPVPLRLRVPLGATILLETRK